MPNFENSQNAKEIIPQTDKIPEKNPEDTPSTYDTLLDTGIMENRSLSANEMTPSAESFGKAHIDNPKILDLIAEIEFGNITDENQKQTSIRNWKNMIANQYQESLDAYKEDPDDEYPGGIYGKGGYDRFTIIKGEVSLINKDSIKATPSALKKAIELGMKIDGSQEPLTDKS